MNFLPAYLDSSALLELVLPERESEPLRAALAAWPDWVTSRVAGVECHRAVRRLGRPSSLAARVRHVLASCTLLHVDEATLRLAEEIGQPHLRSLDAIHLAAALSGGHPGAFVTYDDRLAVAARSFDLVVIAPSVPSPTKSRARIR